MASSSTEKKAVLVSYMGEVYAAVAGTEVEKKAEGEDPKVEEAKGDVGKVAARIRGAIGLIHEEKWKEAGELLEELLKDLEEAKEDVLDEAKK